MCIYSFSCIALRSPLIKEKSHFFQFAPGEAEVLNEQVCPASTDRLLLLRRDPEGEILQLGRGSLAVSCRFYCVSGRQFLVYVFFPTCRINDCLRQSHFHFPSFSLLLCFHPQLINRQKWWSCHNKQKRVSCLWGIMIHIPLLQINSVVIQIPIQ